MFIVADFSACIDIENCVEFCFNKSNNTLAELRRRYDGICYSGVKILRVVSVLRMGECIFASQVSATMGSLSVSFRAIVVALFPGDLLPACTRISKTSADTQPGPIIFRGEHVVVANSQTALRRVIQEDAVVPMIASAISANVPCERLSAIGVIYEPPQTTFFYPITDSTRFTDALTEQKYIKMQDIIDGKLDDAQPCNILEAAMTALDYLRDVKVDNRAVVEKVVFSLFFRKGKVDIPLITVPIAKTIAVPRTATCLVVCHNLNPFNGQVTFTDAKIEDLPPTWKQGALAQPAPLVIRHYLEQIVAYAYTGSELLRAYGTPAIIEKTATFVKYVQSLKGTS